MAPMRPVAPGLAGGVWWQPHLPCPLPEVAWQLGLHLAVEPQMPGQASLTDIWNQLQYITVKTALYTYLHLHISYPRSTHQKS